MKRQNNIELPRVGKRMIKSSVAVFLCFMIYLFFRRDGIIFYSQLAALWCIQPLREGTRGKAVQRTVGTMVGAVFGLIILLIDKNLLETDFIGYLCYDTLVAVAIIGVIYVTLLLHKRDASYFSCVVFLSIVVNHIGDVNPYLFVLNRVLDTMIGLAVGMGINSFHLPRRKEKDILFVSGVDDTLLGKNHQLSPYSKVELNRMIAEGAHFTVSTMRTPASLIETLRDIHLNLPVIAMDGAVMYDIKTGRYVYFYMISNDTLEELKLFLKQFQQNFFINMILDDILIIQYQRLNNEAEQDIYDRLYTSPYRNYTDKEASPQAKCVYIMMIAQTEKIAEIYKKLQASKFWEQLRITTYPSEDYPGFSYIKIYNKNATRAHMIKYLEQKIGVKYSVTFGSIEGKYDVYIEENHDKVAKTLKKMYEPLVWRPSIKSSKNV